MFPSIRLPKKAISADEGSNIQSDTYVLEATANVVVPGSVFFGKVTVGGLYCRNPLFCYVT